ncbi:glycosyltransferase [Candidatus Protochlamydia sp. W-9]|uniref:glycosyltransferase n=1 Tax=Candidatus Protochlamydia sp. W-9 TaxID=1785087 RepID=UPI00096A93DB|nr:glycosyltransferase [Candidatus Protochlamydia sp. W-9]
MSTILIYTPNVVHSKMAGPAIRCWELAKALSSSHHVILVIPNQTEMKGEGFQIIAKQSSELKQWIKKAEILIAQNLTISMAWHAKKNGIKIIIDAYDPLPLEILELFKNDRVAKRKESLNSSLNQLIFNFKITDGILCASEKQRDLWIGFLLSQKLITLSRYDQDKSLRQFIDVVPFGLPNKIAKKDGPGLKEKYSLNSKDKILLWGGGIWNWFDPLTLIKAVKKLSMTRSDIKLVFLGIKNPDPSVPEMEMASKAIKLAEELNILDRHVFFNHDWIPYNERHNSFLDATIGVSTHFDHLETRYSFRTRMLDYIWTGLPILATEGDSFAELIEQNKLGITISYNDEESLINAITLMVDHPDLITEFQNQLTSIRPLFHWNKIIEPINHMIANFDKTPNSSLNFEVIKILTTFVIHQVYEKGFKNTAKIILRKMFNKWR